MPTPASSRALLAAALLAAACGASPEGSGPDGGATAPGITARGVELRAPWEGGELVVRAQRLDASSSGDLALEGDVAVRATGPVAIEAGASRLSVGGGGQRLELSGGVRAVFDAAGDGREVGDAAPDR